MDKIFLQCSYRCGFSDASWFGCGGYQGDEGNADAQHHNTTDSWLRGREQSVANRYTGNGSQVRILYYPPYLAPLAHQDRAIAF